MSKLIANILPYMPRKLVWLFSRRYIAGITIDDAIKVCNDLNKNNMLVTTDLLGEFVTSLIQAQDYKNLYIEIIERFSSEKIKGNFSLKPTMFGLLIDEEICYQYIREIVSKAAQINSFIRLDMEDSQCVDKELNLLKKLNAEFPTNVGIVLQAYLKRTTDDLTKLTETIDSLNIRLCKGIYIEPKEIAYKDYQKIRDQFLLNLGYCFKNNVYVGIATHDKYLVDGALQLIERLNIPESNYEFQMLYGVTPELRNSIINQGHKVRVYVPFGKEWFGYSTRRLKENPQMVKHIIKALFFRG